MNTPSLHESESAKQFQALWKKPAKAANGKANPTPGNVSGESPVSQTDETAEIASAIPPTPQVFPKPTSPRVGQRAPERDPVGETHKVSVRETVRCSFTEMIAVTHSQMEETSVSRFECPRCLAVRDIKSKGDRLKFLSHPKHLTTTPNQGRVGSNGKAPGSLLMQRGKEMNTQPFDAGQECSTLLTGNLRSLICHTGS